MPNLTSADAVWAIIQLLIPGFIFSRVMSTLSTGIERQGAEIFLRYIFFSMIIYVVWGWLPYLVIPSFPTGSVVRYVLWLVLLVVAPFLTAILWVLVLRRLFDWCCTKLRVPMVHRLATAWDWVFEKKQSSFVVVTLKNDTQWHGWYGSGSFSSSDQASRDLFISDVYDFDKATGKWTFRNTSVLISAGEISTVEFLSHEDATQEQCND